MKRTFIAAIILIAIFSFFGSTAFAQEDTVKIPSCTYCGMDRAHFAHSRMLIIYTDGSSTGTCSLHCLAVELALNINKTPSSIQVGDYNTKQLIDAEKAYWIVGGKGPGVMTQRPKWAFADKAAAEAFRTANGGEIVDFDTAVKASYEDMYADTKMIREKRKKMREKKEMHGMNHSMPGMKHQ